MTDVEFCTNRRGSMLTELRKVVTFDEDIYREGEKEAR